MANEKLVERLLWHGEFHIGDAEVSISYQFLDELVEALRAQPSAASGREVPALPHTTYNGYSDGSEPLYTANQMREYALAAITGAAPADANVGGLNMVKVLADGGALSHGVIKDLEEARDTVDQARRDGLQGMYPAAAIVLDMAFSRLLHAISTPTAPEPSAPADKVDAPVIPREWVEAPDSIPNEIITACRDAICKEFGNNGSDGYYKRILAKVFHAAIYRMRSEDGKGGKL